MLHFARYLSANSVALGLMATFVAIGSCLSAAETASDSLGNDWPTYMADLKRSGMSGSVVSPPLALSWVYTLSHPPLPSWPPPAKEDPYNGRSQLHPRVVFDRVSHVVGRTEGGDDQAGWVYLGASADGRLICLDLATGKERWTFATEGPIRCAPTVVGNIIVFGSDDGRVYALERRSGELRWSTRIAPTDERLPGNGRIVSRWPVRTGVTVHNGRGYVSAGLFPVEGVFYAMLDLSDGTILNRVRVDRPLQGYPVERSGRLYMPTGRDPAGAILDARLTITPPGEPDEPEETNPSQYAIIGTPALRFAGGDGIVAAVDAKTGAELWAAAIKGKAYGLALIGRSLLVSTDAGKIYCFTDQDRGDTRFTAALPNRLPVSPEEVKAAGRFVDHLTDAVDVDRGYALIIGTHSGEAAIQLARRTDFRVVGVELTRERAQVAAERIRAAELGHRISIHQLDRDTIDAGELPYVPELFNVVAINTLDEAAGLPTITAAKIRDFVRCYGGVGLITVSESAPTIVKGPPVGAGEWSHTYGDSGNSGCSNDRLVGQRLTTQWYGPPGPRRMVDRHQRNAPPLFVAGRLFVPGDDYVYAVDAFNGTILWEREIPEMRRLAVLRSSGNMAANGQRLYVASGKYCLGLNAASGETEERHQASPVHNAAWDWGYVGLTTDAVLGSLTATGSQRWPVTADSWKIAYEDGQQIIVSRGLVADEQSTGQRRWTYRCAPDGVVLNPTIAHDGETIFFVECQSAAAAAVVSGRPSLASVFAAPSELVALKIGSGDPLFRSSIDISSFQHVIHMSVSGGKVLVTGSKNVAQPDVSELLYYELRCYDATTGDEAWKREHLAARQEIGGVHGEQTQRPVIVDSNRVHLETMAYDLHTGEILWSAPRTLEGGCGTLSCSARYGYRRLNSTPHAIDLRSGSIRALTRTTRPGCWINILPAGGLLLIPESSSGCSCDHGIQTSLVMRPVRQ